MASLSNGATDPSGNPILGDIGVHLTKEVRLQTFECPGVSHKSLFVYCILPDKNYGVSSFARKCMLYVT